MKGGCHAEESNIYSRHSYLTFNRNRHSNCRRRRVLACEGRYYPPGYERSTNVVFTLSNLNADATIRIDRIVVYREGGGNVFCDSDQGTVTAPPSVVGMNIAPNGVQYFMLVAGSGAGYCLDSDLTVTQNYIMKVYWSSSSYKNPLYGKALLRDTNEEGSRVSASVYECTSVK